MIPMGQDETQPQYPIIRQWILPYIPVPLAFNPSNAEATFVQSTRTQRFLKIFLTLSCWYSLDSSRQVLSDEYPFDRVSVIFQVFCIILYWTNSQQQLKG